MTVTENQREIPVLKKVDVIVAGGGVSGISAAIAAGRAGAKVVLIERNGKLGGVMAASLMANIANYYIDSVGNRVIEGISREVIDRCVAKNGASPMWENKLTGSVVVDPEILELVFIEMLEEANVQVLLHTYAADILKEKSRLQGLIIESKWGRRAILANSIVDCTGEMDIAYKVGAPFKDIRGTASMLFRMAYVDIDKFVNYLVEENQYPENVDCKLTTEDFCRNWKENGFFFFPHHGGKKLKLIKEAIEKGEYSSEKGIAFNLDAFGMYSLTDKIVAINSNYYTITKELLNIEDISKMELNARKMCHYAADFLKIYMPGFENSVLVSTGSDLGIRLSRVIETDFTITGEDRTNGTKFYDTVGTTCTDTREEGYIHRLEGWMDIPLRCMIAKGVDNLVIGSGKSVDTKPAGVLRGMARCMSVGQGAGVAAVIAASNGCAIKDVNIQKVQKELLRQGVFLGDKCRLKELGLEKGEIHD